MAVKSDWFEIVPGHWMNKRLMRKLFKQWRDAYPKEWARVKKAKWR